MIRKFLQCRGIKRTRQLKQSIREISQQLEASRELGREREMIFNALSDCVFLLSDRELVRANSAAREVLQSSEAPEAIIHSLATARAGPAPSPGDWIQQTSGDGDPILLRIHTSLPFRLREGPARLVLAENLSWLLRSAWEFQEKTQTERRRIAKDLHDGISQILTFLTFQAEFLKEKESILETRELFERISRMAGECTAAATTLVQKYETEGARSPIFTQDRGLSPIDE